MLKSSISALALAVALGGGFAAFAQTEEESPAAEAAPAAETPSETAADTKAAETGEAEGSAATPSEPGNNLSTGIAVGESDDSPNYTKETFGKWEQRCIKTDLSADPCELYMLLKDNEGNSVAEISIFNLPEGAQAGPVVAGATFVAPLETLLTTGVQVSVDGGKARAYPFTVCTQASCISRIGFSGEEIAQLKKGAKATALIVPFRAPDQPVTLEIPLEGFTKGYEAVVTQNKAADASADEAAKAAATPEPAKEPAKTEEAKPNGN